MDEPTGYFFFTHKDQEDIILRKKEVYDGATPSGNSIMAENLFYLSVVYNIPEWYVAAEKITTALGNAILRYPTSFGVWASLILKVTFGINELVITGKDFFRLNGELLQLYMPGKIVQCGPGENERFPMLKGKNPGNETLIYWCRQYSCKTPVTTIEKLVTEMNNGNKI